jgi:DNA polymerase III epsilon subunit-like protein
MTKTYSGLVHLNGNLLAAIDLETTGLQAGYHEPIQIAVVPLNSDIRPLEGVRPFYTTIRPSYPERQEKSVGYVHGLPIEELVLHAPDAGKVADLLVEWWEKLDLPFGKTLIPLAHNWAFECKFLQSWLGVDLTSQLFFGHARDAMLYALALNDKAAFMGLPVPFNKVGLGSICKRFKVHNASPHDALSDALAEAECYRATAKNCSFAPSQAKPTLSGQTEAERDRQCADRQCAEQQTDLHVEGCVL